MTTITANVELKRTTKIRLEGVISIGVYVANV